MKLVSRWQWLTILLALGLGAAGGAVVTQQRMIRSMEAREQAKAAEIAAAQAPRPPVAQPLEANSKTIPESPFDVLDSQKSRRPFTREPAPGAHPEGADQPAPPMEEDVPIKVEPPLVVRDGRVELDPPPGYFDLPASNKNDGTDPPIVKSGQIIQVEVLEALPARPITGDRVVRSDGTISLGFYGDLRVVGLNRYQIKLKLLERLRNFISDETLGLITGEGKGVQAISPVESNRVFIDETRVMEANREEQGDKPPVKLDSTNQDTMLARMGRLEVHMLKMEILTDLFRKHIDKDVEVDELLLKMDRVLQEFEANRKVREANRSSQPAPSKPADPLPPNVPETKPQ